MSLRQISMPVRIQTLCAIGSASDRAAQDATHWQSPLVSGKLFEFQLLRQVWHWLCQWSGSHHGLRHWQSQCHTHQTAEPTNCICLPDTIGPSQCHTLKLLTKSWVSLFQAKSATASNLLATPGGHVNYPNANAQIDQWSKIRNSPTIVGRRVEAVDRVANRRIPTRRERPARKDVTQESHHEIHQDARRR
jgi:hypothetical protein